VIIPGSRRLFWPTKKLFSTSLKALNITPFKGLYLEFSTKLISSTFCSSWDTVPSELGINCGGSWDGGSSGEGLFF
jgi:hypothetical protein